MGWLDQSTNNIILDAVLTDQGRQLLASQGRFVITKFTFGDDGVDYGIITQYGRQVGKEKIEKNTPIFEALTNPSLAIRNNLVSISTVSNSVTYMPILSITSNNSSTTGTSAGTLTIPLSFTSSTPALVNLLLTISDGFSCPPELIDDDFYVEVDNRFLRASSKTVSTPISVASNSVATYVFPSDATSATGNLASLAFNLTPQSVPAATQAAFKVPGTTYVTTYVTVIGRNSGQRKDIKVNITTVQ